MSLSCKYLGSTDAQSLCPSGPLATAHEWHGDGGVSLALRLTSLTGQLQLRTDLELFKDFNNQLFTQRVPVFYLTQQ